MTARPVWWVAAHAAPGPGPDDVGAHLTLQQPPPAGWHSPGLAWAIQAIWLDMSHTGHFRWHPAEASYGPGEQGVWGDPKGPPTVPGWRPVS